MQLLSILRARIFLTGSVIGILVKSLNDLPTAMAKDGTEMREVLRPKNDPIGNHLSLAHRVVKKGLETRNHVLEIVEI